MKKILILVVNLILFTSCMDSFDDNDLKINNLSKDSIYLIISKNDTIFNYEKYEIYERIKNGERLASIDLSGMGIFSDIIKPDTIVEEKGYWDWKSALRNKKARLYIIKKDSVDKYGWKGIHTKNLYNKKYTLDIDDLDSLNWTIEYNGN